MTTTTVNEIAFEGWKIPADQMERILDSAIQSAIMKMDEEDKKILTSIINKFVAKTEVSSSIKNFGRKGIIETMAKTGILLSILSDEQMEDLPIRRRSRRL